MPPAVTVIYSKKYLWNPKFCLAECLWYLFYPKNVLTTFSKDKTSIKDQKKIANFRKIESLDFEQNATCWERVDLNNVPWRNQTNEYWFHKLGPITYQKMPLSQWGHFLRSKVILSSRLPWLVWKSKFARIGVDPASWWA